MKPLGVSDDTFLCILSHADPYTLHCMSLQALISANGGAKRTIQNTPYVVPGNRLIRCQPTYALPEWKCEISWAARCILHIYTCTIE